VSLGIKATIVLVLMISVGILMLLARRRNFEQVRRHYTTRRTRVPTEPKSPENPAPPADPTHPVE
jgi:hypothetical protein